MMEIQSFFFTDGYHKSSTIEMKMTVRKLTSGESYFQPDRFFETISVLIGKDFSKPNLRHLKNYHRIR